MCGTTSSTTNAPNPAAAANYADVTARAKGVADTPYQPYGGELVAGLNGGQNQAIGELQSAYGTANPYFNSASGYLGNANQGLGGVQNYLQAGSQSVGNAQGYAGQAAGLANPNANQQYMNPYTNSVINATMAQAQQQDAIQRQGLASNAIGQGAYGGDRAGVAQAALAGQQDLANNQTIAGLNSANYAQANAARVADAGVYGNLANSANQSAGLYGTLGQTQAQTASAQGQLAGLSGYIGSAAQQAAISGASAGLQGSTLQQQNAQQQDQAAYGQFQNQISYPFQTTNWLSNIDMGIGNQQGGIQTQQGSALSQIAGAGTAGLGILGATGAFGSNGYLTGAGGLFSSLARGGRVSRARGGGLAGGRIHYMDGGDAGLVDPNAPVGVQPPQGISFAPTGLMGGGGFNPTAPAAAFAPVGQQRSSSGSVAPVRMPILGADPAAETPPPAAGLAAASGAGGGLAGGAPASQGVVGGPEMNKWLAITAAGLGMMGGTSASAGVNIGKGGLAGLQEYTQLQNMDRQNAMQQAELGLKRGSLGIDQQRADQDAQRLQQQAEQFKQQNTIQTGQLANSTKNTDSEIQQRRAQTAASLQTITPAGIMQRDPDNPMAPPRLIPWAQVPGMGASGGDLPPPPGAAPAPGGQPPAGGQIPAGAPDPAAPGVSVGPNPASQPAAPTPAPGLDAIGKFDPPKGVPINPMQLTPDGQKQLLEESTKKTDAHQAAYDAAQNQMMLLGEIEQNLGQLPPSGWLAAGPGQQQRADMANKVTTALRGFGIEPPDDLQNQIASSESVKKLTGKLGFADARALGGREAGFIVQQAVSLNPSTENSPMGAQRLISGLKAAAQRNIDLYTFEQKWKTVHNGDLTGADEYFNKWAPPEKYANAAVASTIPQGARQMLAQNPKLASAFDAKYGNGVSKIVLGQ